MDRKELIRRKFFLKRKNRYFNVSEKYFLPLVALIEKKFKNKRNISLYYPNSFEINIFKIFDVEYFKYFNYSLPIIEKKKRDEFLQMEEK